MNVKSKLDIAHVKEIHIYGYGPSLREFRWAEAPGPAIGLNDTIFHFEPMIHLWRDPKIVPRYAQVAYNPLIKIITSEENAEGFRKQAQVEDDQLYPWSFVKDPRKLGDAVRKGEKLWHGSTIACAGILLAWQLGAERAYLWGCDAYAEFANHDGDFVTHAHGKYGHIGGARKKPKKGKEPNLIKDKGVWMFPVHKDWIEDHRKVCEFLKGEEFTVFNCSPRSCIDAWEFMDPKTFGHEEVT